MKAALPAGAKPLPAERSAALAPFVAAALAALRDWAGVEGYPAAEWLGPLGAGRAGFAAAVALRRAVPGRLHVALDETAAAALVARVFAEAGAAAAPDLVGDCVGELANLIAGRAKALLHGTPAHFQLGTPILGDAGPTDLAVARLECELGAVVLGLA